MPNAEFVNPFLDVQYFIYGVADSVGEGQDPHLRLHPLAELLTQLQQEALQSSQSKKDRSQTGKGKGILQNQDLIHK